MVWLFGCRYIFCFKWLLNWRITCKGNGKNGINFPTLKLFVIRRWLRTLPNYYFTLLVYILIFLLFKNNIHFPEFRSNWVFNIVREADLWRYFVFLQFFFEPFQSFFIQSWSLCVEELVYIVVPLSLLLFRRFGLKSVLIFLFVASFLLKIILFYKGRSHTYLFYRPSAILIGLLFSVIYLKRKSFFIQYKNHFFILSLLIFITAFFVYITKDMVYSKTPYSLLTALLLIISFSLSIPFFSDLNVSNKLIRKIIIQISILSYSIYLNHFIPILIIDIIGVYIIEMNLIVKYLLFFSGTYILSIFQYKYIETPFLIYREKKFSR